MRFVSVEGAPVFKNQQQIAVLARGTPGRIGRRQGDYVEFTPTENWSKGPVWISGQYLTDAFAGASASVQSALTKQGGPQGSGQCWNYFKYLWGIDDRVGQAKRAGPVLERNGFRYVGSDPRLAVPGAALVFPTMGPYGHIATSLGNGMMRDNQAHQGRPIPSGYPVQVYVRVE